MEHTKKVIIPAQPAIPERTEEVYSHTTCDLCQERTTPGQYRVAYALVECEIGDSYPEGGTTSHTSFDICTTCFIDKLVPWFQSQGANPVVKEVSW